MTQLLPGLLPDELKKLILSVGTHRGRRPLSPSEVAHLLAKSEKAGASRETIAEAISLSPTMIGKFLKLQELAPSVRDFATWGSSSEEAGVPFSVAAELARLPATDHANGLEAAIAHGLSRPEMVKLVQLASRTHRSMSDCLAEVLEQRPKREEIHVFVGLLPKDVSSSLCTMSQEERDDILSVVLRDLSLTSLNRHRLGAEKFVLVGDESFGRKLDSEGQLEERIAGGIRRLL